MGVRLESLTYLSDNRRRPNVALGPAACYQWTSRRPLDFVAAAECRRPRLLLIQVFIPSGDSRHAAESLRGSIFGVLRPDEPLLDGLAGGGRVQKRQGLARAQARDPRRRRRPAVGRDRA